MKILIVQPHSDDALLSCYHLFDSTNKIVILTVEDDQKRISEDKQLQDIFNDVVIDNCKDTVDGTYSDYWKKHKIFNWREVLKLYIKKYDYGEYKHLKYQLIDKITKCKNKGFTIFVPFGAGHPFHLIIHKICYNLADYFYRDFPHSYKTQRGLRYFEEQKNNYRLVSSTDVTPFQAEKIRIFGEVYKSQRAFQFYEKNNLEKCYPEEIYERIK